MKINLITGATGFLGSHIAETLRARGETVRALVRGSSDTAFLQSLGVELAVGDLGDRDSVRRAVDGAAVVYHCAARVRDWGAWRQFQTEVVDATAQLLACASEAGVGRFLHVSSISAYGHPPGAYGPSAESGREFTEDEPLGQKPWVWDHYTRSKTIADQLVQQASLPWTVIRPCSMYGPRDRGLLPRALKALAAGRVALIGSGDNRLNLLYVGDVADGAIRAANTPGAVGRAYNFTSAGEITQREFLDLLSADLGLPPVARRVPFRLAHFGGFLAEMIGKMIRLQRSPHFTRHSIALMGRSTRFSSRRAREELDWQPRTPIHEGLRQALDWQWAHATGLPARPQPVAAGQVAR